MHPTPPASRTAVTVVVTVVATVVLGAGMSGCSTSDGTAAEPAGATASTAPAVPSASPMPTFDPQSVVGDYAPGFPADLLAAPDDMTVLASSAVPRDDDLVEVSLNLATPLPVDDVVEVYAERLADAGFTAADPDDMSPSDLTTYTAYTRTKGKKDPRFESVHLGVLDDGELRLVTISGVVQRPEDG
ncbi:hypothetical protein ACNHYB_01770 [Isoptericola jiangsuensis]|uniref:hypothetical protein n=1 Tax=Isoptericola jiangsuensis TaxID=548579 RepID=UPI003AAC4B64